MSNIYLKVIIDAKNRRSQTFDFPGLKNLPGRFWGAPTHEDIIEF